MENGLLNIMDWLYLVVVTILRSNTRKLEKTIHGKAGKIKLYPSQQEWSLSKW